MKKYFLIILCALPFVSQAQMTAVTPDETRPTQWLTGNPESVYVFFDKTSATLSARDVNGVTSDFKWYWLNPVDTTLTLRQTNNSASSSSLTINASGGYQVRVTNASRDTLFSCWVFFDNFRVDTISHTNDCDALRLDMITTPSIYAGYTIYNFESFLNPPHVGDSTFLGVQKISWDAEENIHAGVTDPNENWKLRQGNTTFIDDPAPLKNSRYTVKVIDVFGKEFSYTTPYTIPAIAAYSKIKAEEKKKDQWNEVSVLEGDALYEVRFSNEESLNAQEFYWKGFGNAQTQSQREIIWQEFTTSPSGWIIPKVLYKNETLNAYTSGSYSVRLTVVNTTTPQRCADSTEIKITVKPSSFDPMSIPNAFTPNGDGENDFFLFVKGKEPVSIRSIKIQIYSRSGMLVYSYEGTIDAWEGWNGKLNNSGNDVSDGVYYYIISGKGWDDTQYNDKNYKGVLHIFR